MAQAVLARIIEGEPDPTRDPARCRARVMAALIAASAPARRALRIDPVTALSSE